MAILRVSKLARTIEDDDSLNGEYTETYEVTVDDPDDRTTSLGDILAADDGDEAIPQIGDAHGEDAAAICYKRAVEQNGFVYSVRVQYSTQKTDSPLTAPAKVRWDSREYKRPITLDVADPPVNVVNTAGMPFDPHPEVDDADMTLTITRNESTFDPVAAMGFRYTLPTATFYGFAAVQCRMRPIVANRILDPFQYWEVTYVIDFCDRVDEDGNQKGWTLRVLSEGFVELVSGARRAITNGDGQPISQSALLAADGTKLAVGGTPVYLEFDGYRSVNWASLNLEGV